LATEFTDKHGRIPGVPVAIPDSFGAESVDDIGNKRVVCRPCFSVDSVAGVP
jgi:hypothetical protein